jgi:hypothetical protein
MPTYDTLITGFAVGDDLDIVRTVTGVPSGQIITSAALTIKELEASETAKLVKTITSALTVSGFISGNTLTFVLSGGDTNRLNPGNYEYFSVEVFTDAGKTYTPEKGRIKADL